MKTSENPLTITLNYRNNLNVDLENLVYLQADSNYTRLYLQDGSRKVSAKTLKHFYAQLLDHGFLRIHRSLVINPQYIKHLNTYNHCVELTNGLHLSISRRKRKVFRMTKEEV
ncbi:LytTr DNA-binding domain-containing protein [Pseudarcicella hirudinis]|uniref:LytTr DNA-binding domain-containing protein n=1 Tax=Pseudarcicella hirudinis TaxID=1079859 RepID=A0A1I5YRK5_9BACT|nr:LytTR family DNA-binding domain-containing protein [Pseudarcicella hirudinis]SFQ46914.1 LytTr DNA-binding domain-containing protein [Pseudarcicella hirudinis]